jgi:hypothetical protein
VAITSDWIMPAVRWVVTRLRRQPSEAAVEERLQQLQSKKAELAQSIDQRRAAARFEPEVEQESSPDLPQVLDEVSSPSSASRASQTPPPEQADQSESDSYTARLLEAKRRARKEHEKKRGQE